MDRRFVIARNLAMLISLLFVSWTLSACTDTDEYPITGIECGPDDPVQTIGDCRSPV